MKMLRQWCIVIGLISPLCAVETVTPKVFREESASKQFWVESNSEEMNHALLSLAEEARAGLSPYLKLQEERRYRTSLRVFSEKNSNHRVTLRGWSEAGKLGFTIGIPQPIATEAVLRELTTVFLYEKILPRQKTWKSEEELPLIPYWLIEGTLQRLYPRRVEIWQKIVDRAILLERVPEFKTVQEWKEPSDDLLECAWRQAFSFKAVQALTANDIKKTHFSDWLLEGAPERTMPAFFREVSRETDWRGWLQAAAPQSEVIMSWEETERRVGALLVIPLKSRKDEANNILARWDELGKVRNHWDLRRALDEQLSKLIEVEASAHFSWRPVIFQMRMTLQQLKAERDRFHEPTKPVKAFVGRGTSQLKPEDPIKPSYEDLVPVVQNELKSLQGRNKKIEDYLNWFIVTEKTGEMDLMFQPYIQLKDRLLRDERRKDDPFVRDAIRVEQGQRK